MALAESHFVHGAWIPATLVAALVFLFVVSVSRRGRKARKADGRSNPLNFQPVAAYHETKEELAIRDLRQRFAKGEEPPENLFLQLAWSRALDVDAAESVWRRHLTMTRELRISDVSDELVRSAYRAGFCVRSGLDVDGRPMIWVRLAKSVPSNMTAAQVVKNTWMAQDATLASGAEANRQGICFVYDLTGVGLKNLTFDPMALRDVIRGALSHPCHISRVWLLDAPRIFLLSWHAFKHFVPADVRKLVRFAETRATGRPNDFSQVCPESELPVYLGGDPGRFAQPYSDWMFNELEGQALAYRTSKLLLPVPSRRNIGRSGATCYVGIRKLLRCFCFA
eukprot:Skav219620  [mRNA]  locus=scaffold628:158888:159901:- [translate_table: standard]